MHSTVPSFFISVTSTSERAAELTREDHTHCSPELVAWRLTTRHAGLLLTSFHGEPGAADAAILVVLTAAAAGHQPCQTRQGPGHADACHPGHCAGVPWARVLPGQCLLLCAACLLLCLYHPNTWFAGLCTAWSVKTSVRHGVFSKKGYTKTHVCVLCALEKKVKTSVDNTHAAHAVTQADQLTYYDGILKCHVTSDQHMQQCWSIQLCWRLAGGEPRGQQVCHGRGVRGRLRVFPALARAQGAVCINRHRKACQVWHELKGRDQQGQVVPEALRQPSGRLGRVLATAPSIIQVINLQKNLHIVTQMSR